MDSSIVLIIEDQQLVANSMAVWLRQAGYEVEVAADSRAALELASRRKIGAVLLDWHLSDRALTAPHLIDALHARCGQATPILVVSGDWGAFSNSARTAATDYLHKPFTPDDLLRKVGTYFAVRPPSSR